MTEQWDYSAFRKDPGRRRVTFAAERDSTETGQTAITGKKGSARKPAGKVPRGSSEAENDQNPHSGYASLAHSTWLYVPHCMCMYIILLLWLVYIL